MTGSVVPLRGSSISPEPDLRLRLEDILVLLQAIESGDLLGAFPACDIARSQHQTALRLLAIAERELADVCRRL